MMKFMKFAISASAILITIAALSLFWVRLHGATAADFEDSAQSLDSPRLAALAKEVHGGNSAALAAFWKQVQGKGPLIESIPGDKQNDWVTFLYRGGNGVQRVNVVGGPP